MSLLSDGAEMKDQGKDETKKEKRTSSRPPPDSGPATDRRPPAWDSPDVIVTEDDGDY